MYLAIYNSFRSTLHLSFISPLKPSLELLKKIFKDISFNLPSMFCKCGWSYVKYYSIKY